MCAKLECELAELEIGDKKAFLIIKHPTGNEYKYVYHTNYNLDNGKLDIAVKKFVDIFNSIDYALTKIISSPVFQAYERGIYENPYLRSFIKLFR